LAVVAGFATRPTQRRSFSLVANDPFGSGGSGERSANMIFVIRNLSLAALAVVAALVVIVSASAATQPKPYVQILSSPEIVPKGEQGTLVAKVTPSNANCDLVIYLSSGPSQARGLGRRRAVNGRVSWTWTVARNTSGGTHPTYVECGTTGIAKTWIRYV
jgi:hypothetical protein